MAFFWTKTSLLSDKNVLLMRSWLRYQYSATWLSKLWGNKLSGLNLILWFLLHILQIFAKYTNNSWRLFVFIVRQLKNSPYNLSKKTNKLHARYANNTLSQTYRKELHVITHGLGYSARRCMTNKGMTLVISYHVTSLPGLCLFYVFSLNIKY